MLKIDNIFLIFTNKNSVGLKIIFFNNCTINITGFIIMIEIIFFIKFMMYKLVFINILLNTSIYIITPQAIPINIYALNSPLLNLNIEYNIMTADKIQNKTSSKQVIKSLVLKDLRSILKKSNKIEIKKPFIIKIINKYAWFSKLSPYLNIFPKRDDPFLFKSFSE